MKKIDWHAGFVNGTTRLNDKYKMHADSVMNVFARANKELLRDRKESDDKMCEAINELFAEETAAYKKQAEEANTRAEAAEAELNDTKNKLQEALEEISRLKAAAN